MLSPVFSLNVKEADGSPSVFGVRTIVVANGSLTDDGSGQVTLAAASASPGGSSGQIQWNNAGAFGGAAALTYAASSTHLTVTAQAATDVPLTISLATSQTADGLRVRNASAGNLIRVTSAGAIALHENGSSRSGLLSYNDANGEYRFGRTDHSNTIGMRPEASGYNAIVFNSLPGYVRSGSGVIVITGREDGVASTVDFNRRPADDSATIGGDVRCWTKTSQTTDPLQVLAPGGGSKVWAVRPSGAQFATPQSPAQITSNQNDYSPTAADTYRLSTDASRDITGLAAGTSGQFVRIVNVGSNDIVVKHQDANSTAVNRFLSVTGADITLGANQIAEGWYDGTTQRWRIWEV